MAQRPILVGTLMSLALLVACGDDDMAATRDAGLDAGDTVERSGAGGSANAGRGGAAGGGRAGAGAGASASGGSGAAGTGGGSGASGGAGASGGSGEGAAGGSGAMTYTVGGQASGLTGTGLVLQNNGGDDLSVSAAGSFVFGARLEDGAGYAVTVKTQPHDPAQACTLTKGSGSVGGANVEDVQVTCATNKYTIGGTVAGLTGAGLKLRNNGADELTASGATFMFATSVDSGAGYAVTVSAQPSGQTCGITNGSGQVAGAHVDNVAVSCFSPSVLQVEPGFGTAIASWTNTGATAYTLKGTTLGSCDLAATACPNAIEIANGTSPATIPGLTNGTVYYFQLSAAHPAGVSVPSNKTQTRPNKPEFDGSVNALVTAGSVTYAGGSFSRMSVLTGNAVPVHKTTGFPSELPNFPIVDGNVFGLAADATGGYYIGGPFITVGGQARNGLAHIKSDGTLDADWHPDVTGGIVYTIAVHNGTVYVAGTFTNIGGQARAGLAAIGANGTVSMTWNPNPVGSVGAIAFWHDDVVVGGSFTNITAAVTPRPFLAMLDGTTAALRPWAANSDALVNAVAVDGDTIYVGGEFRNIGGAPRDRLAALNATGSNPGEATAWDPGCDNAVSTMSFANNTLYIAGLFQHLGSPPVARAGLAAVNTTGAASVKIWNPALLPTNSVPSSLLAVGDTVYMAGSFTSVNGMRRNGVAATSGADAGTLSSWDPNPDGSVQHFALVGDAVVLVGELRGLRGLDRKHLAAFDASGTVTSWNPGADNDVFALALSGTTLYVGGQFASLSGMARNSLAAVDTSGTLASWNPNVDGPVYALAVAATTVYAGGNFQNVNTSTARSRLAAFPSTGTATATSWNPGANSSVRALAASATDLYVGGEFTQLGGQSRNRIGAVGLTSATATTWDPNIAGTSVNAIVATADTVYAGGVFTTVGAAPVARANFAALSVSAPATLATWAPNPNAAVNTLLLSDSRLYLGGDFTLVDTTTNRDRYAVYGHLTTTPVVETDPTYLHNFDREVRALSPGAAGVIYAGGAFQSLDGVFTSSYAVIVPAAQ
jgi:hypothetical protein